MILETLDTRRKALSINLDQNIYGTFAEIGAGQEVARNFFTAGAASGTIAKTMSAYDMTFSDEIYGAEPSGRYVSKSRLEKMLDHEFELLGQRLCGVKYEQRKFFSFANTVTTLNYSKSNDPHGWIGVKFQLEPCGPANQIIFHVRLLDSDATLQQNILGILGVNLVYAAFYHHNNPQLMIESLSDNLSNGSVEIDLISVKGPAFENLSEVLVNLYLIQKGFSPAAVFVPKIGVIQSKDLMYKKNIMILRTRFNQKTKPDFALFADAVACYKRHMNIGDEALLTMAELTLNNLMDATIPADDELVCRVAKRADEILEMGHAVIISNFSRNNKLAKYLGKAKPASVGITTNISNLKHIFLSENYGADYTSELLAYVSDLFSNHTKLLVFPYRDIKNKKLVTTKNLEVSPEAKPLFDFLLLNKYIVDMEDIQ
ncbi:nicotinamide mononucleotide adenylyltransferase [Pelobium manganitolerans]|uniref:Nicotinamide mononucleotide adenylyltransferase n=1 Tax=Pelobium manganitolerans TaxID=1842495 RepID=A0A419S385_9SPHI|nr:nicotinamide mononucleotide adenylyltransferase [Pelobium manganitolerans]RKD13737.1 nicotinamide mononucleotide adenylyltransferase [Pelobium manganitolerans]